MAWNEPGNGKDKDPWGNRGGKDQGTPDLDVILARFGRKLSALLGGGGSSSGNSFSGFGVALLLGLLLVFYLFFGFYTVKEAERGVLLRFGKFHEIVTPGLHWRFPLVDSVKNVNVKRVQEATAKGDMLTEDENVVQVEMNVQYRVLDPERYLYSVTSADDSLVQAIDSALRSVIGHTRMDDILTTGRELVRQTTREQLEEIIKPYDMGLEIVDVNFLPARPPEEVKDAFDDAIAAQEDEQRFIREAEAYAKAIEPEARGHVKRLEQEASAYRQQKILAAQGEVALFEQLLPQYKAAPKVTRDRLYLETMEKVFGSTSKVLVDTKGSGNLLYLPIDKLVQSSTEGNDEISSEYQQVTLPSSGRDLSSDSTSRSPARTTDRTSRGR